MAPLIRPAALFLICSIPRVAYAQPTLTANDFQCFIQRFVAGDPYADCDLSGQNQNTGWTTLTPPPGNRTWAVAANGTSYGLGTESSPLDTPQRAIDRAAPGDFIVIRCNDQWVNLPQLNVTKSVTITTYGAGPAPLLGFIATGIHIDNVPNVRIVGLDVSGRNADDTSGIIAIRDCDNLLIEGCRVANFADNIVVHDLDIGARVTGVKIRRNVVCDAGHPTGIRSQGAYFKNLDGLVVEENVFDNNGVDGSPESHNIYIDDECGPSTVIGNVFANCPADNQMRSGGLAENNLFLRNPIGLWMGGNNNQARYNVVIESGDINPNHLQGIGIRIDGANAKASRNVFAYNNGTGWGSVKGLWFMGPSGACEGTDNFIYDWARTTGPGQIDQARAIMVEGGSGVVTLTGNRVFMPRGAIVERSGTATITGASDTFTQVGGTYPAFYPVMPAGWASGNIADPQLRQRLPGGGIAAYLALALQQSKQSWNPALEARSVNAILRPAVGLPANPP